MIWNEARRTAICKQWVNYLAISPSEINFAISGKIKMDRIHNVLKIPPSILSLINWKSSMQTLQLVNKMKVKAESSKEYGLFMC